MMRKFGRFVIASLSVSGLSAGLIYLLTDVIGLWYMHSAIITSAILAVISFSVNYLWTWHIESKELRSMTILRFAKYVVVGSGATLIAWSLLYALTEFAHLWYMISLAIAWVVAMTIAFSANSSWTYREGE